MWRTCGRPSRSTFQGYFGLYYLALSPSNGTLLVFALLCALALAACAHVQRVEPCHGVVAGEPYISEDKEAGRRSGLTAPTVSKQNMVDLNEMRAEIADAIALLLIESGVIVDTASDLIREVVAAFAFGMAFGFGHANALEPPDVHALAITVLIDSVGFDAEMAGGLSQYLIHVSEDPSVHPTLHAIIRRGIDGYTQWSGPGRSEAVKNLKEVIAAFRQASN